MPNIKAMTSNRTAPYSPTARQARRRSGLRKNSIAIFMMLLVEYGLGMGVSLYARVPAADHGAGVLTALGRALTSQPVLLAGHATLGLLMLAAGVSVLTRGVLARIAGQSPPRRPAWPPSLPQRSAAPHSSAASKPARPWRWPSSPVWRCWPTWPPR